MSDAATVKERCYMKQNFDFNSLSASQVSKLIDGICIN